MNAANENPETLSECLGGEDGARSSVHLCIGNGAENIRARDVPGSTRLYQTAGYYLWPYRRSGRGKEDEDSRLGVILSKIFAVRDRIATR